MRTISRQVYEELGGIHSESRFGLTTEKFWYSHGELLGIVLLDNVDHDWSFVAIANDLRNSFRCYDVGVSFRTPELAQAALATAFETGPDVTFFTEEV